MYSPNQLVDRSITLSSHMYQRRTFSSIENAYIFVEHRMKSTSQLRIDASRVKSKNGFDS